MFKVQKKITETEQEHATKEEQIVFPFQVCSTAVMSFKVSKHERNTFQYKHRNSRTPGISLQIKTL